MPFSSDLRLLRCCFSSATAMKVCSSINENEEFSQNALEGVLVEMQDGALTLYSEVVSTPVRWLRYPFIAIGKITLLQGDPGDGKSTMMMSLIATVTTGGRPPNGVHLEKAEKVIYQCSEDSAADTIKPRLEKEGADCRKVAFINKEIACGLTLDDERIRNAIIEFRPRLVVIDPIQAYLSSETDLQIAGRARRLMQHLGMWVTANDDDRISDFLLCKLMVKRNKRYIMIL